MVAADARRLEGWLLALQARGIPVRVDDVPGGVQVVVPTSYVDAARGELEALDAEERERQQAAELAARAHDPFHSRFAPIGGALFALALLAFYLVTGPSSGHSAWFEAGASSAARVLDGEWWRTITALTLHADSNHVLSNIALGGIVVAAVMRRTGVGFGAGLVVLAGALGNAINAVGYRFDHNSIGFSTAVFGAIGLLGGLTFASARRGALRRPAWIAIGGSIGLLAMLGAAEHTDILAHLFGTAAGLALGIAVGLARWRPRTWLGQSVAGAVTIAAVAGAWALAFASA